MVKLFFNGHKRLTLLFLTLLVSGHGNVMASKFWAESYRHEAMGEYANAAKDIEPLLRHKPDHEFALTRHAWLNYLQGKNNAAIEDYKNVAKLNPKSLDAMLGITLPLLAQKRWREAASYATKVLAIAPWNYFAHVRLMICEEGQEQWKTLAFHANAVSKRFPTDTTILVYQARANSHLGNIPTARTLFKKVLERIPNHVEAKQFLNNQLR